MQLYIINTFCIFAFNSNFKAYRVMIFEILQNFDLFLYFILFKCFRNAVVSVFQTLFDSIINIKICKNKFLVCCFYLTNLNLLFFYIYYDKKIYFMMSLFIIFLAFSLRVLISWFFFSHMNNAHINTLILYFHTFLF